MGVTITAIPVVSVPASDQVRLLAFYVNVLGYALIDDEPRKYVTFDDRDGNSVVLRESDGR
jgi:catechol 2,3-dioxygenase-like lactoylglutathione lyase family enzyme